MHTLLANLSRKEERAQTTASKKNSQLINTFIDSISSDAWILFYAIIFQALFSIALLLTLTTGAYDEQQSDLSHTRRTKQGSSVVFTGYQQSAARSKAMNLEIKEVFLLSAY